MILLKYKIRERRNIGQRECNFEVADSPMSYICMKRMKEKIFINCTIIRMGKVIDEMDKAYSTHWS